MFPYRAIEDQIILNIATTRIYYIFVPQIPNF